uniref:Ig-like domain-containing protein n=1 Tax=Erpetoichthys calabaricus TaxID=27687 RepID=A0A8C4SBH9_ERPCA
QYLIKIFLTLDHQRLNYFIFFILFYFMISSCTVLYIDVPVKYKPYLLRVKLCVSTYFHVTAVPKLDLHYQTSSENPNIFLLICSAVGFYPPNITLSWDHSLHEVTHSILPDVPTLFHDGTYNISSILHVKTYLWGPGEEIGCVVNHSSLTWPLRKNIMREGDSCSFYTLLLTLYCHFDAP